MFRYTLTRLAQTIPTLLFVTLLVFLIVRFIPGDPALLIAGDSATPERVAEIRHHWGLDRPVYVQYVTYMQKLVTGDLGVSIASNSAVSEEIVPRFAVTVKLAVAGTAAAVVVGLVAGILSAVRPYSWVDYITTALSLLGVSVPIFWSGLVGIILFSVKLGWLPSGGTGSLKHYVLPALSLGLFTAGVIARQTRSTMMDVLLDDYIRTARSKGVAERVVIWRHALKNALIPVVTVIGIQFGRMLGGAILTESVFALPGIGRFLVQAISARDYPVIQATVLMFAASFVLVNLIVDLLYGMLDPRIRTD